LGVFAPIVRTHPPLSRIFDVDYLPAH
jgi:hypothetical protein